MQTICCKSILCQIFFDGGTNYFYPITSYSWRVIFLLDSKKYCGTTANTKEFTLECVNVLHIWTRLRSQTQSAGVHHFSITQKCGLYCYLWNHIFVFYYHFTFIIFRLTLGLPWFEFFHFSGFKPEMNVMWRNSLWWFSSSTYSVDFNNK